jgi:hypothetical protein
MSVKVQYGKVVLDFAILAVFLLSNTAFAFHHHASDHPASEHCHICYVHHHSATAIHAAPDRTISYTGHVIHEPTPPVANLPAPSIFLELANYRAPPVRTTA